MSLQQSLSSFLQLDYLNLEMLYIYQNGPDFASNPSLLYVAHMTKYTIFIRI